MKISGSEYSRFRNVPIDPALRFGQAWYNHFRLHRHTAATEEERRLLDRIYNEPNPTFADVLINDNFIDWGN